MFAFGRQVEPIRAGGRTLIPLSVGGESGAPLIAFSKKVSGKYRLRTALATAFGDGYVVTLNVSDAIRAMDLVGALSPSTEQQLLPIQTILAKLQRAGAKTASLSVWPVAAEPLTLSQTMKALR